MNRRFIAILALCLGLAASGEAEAAVSARQASAHEGARWIAGKQASDGGFFGNDQRADLTAEALGSMIAGGVTNGTVDDALAHIRKNGKKAAKRGAFTGRIVAGLFAAGADPKDFGGVDYVTILRSQYQDGAHDADQFFDNLLAANGALAAGDSFPSEAVSYIRDNECSGGGFGFDNDCASGADVDTTAWAINVLVAAGQEGDAMVTGARDFLVSQQNDDGGFGFTKSKPTSADSTGLVLSALAALAESPMAAPWERSGGDPVAALDRLQHSSGGFRFIAATSKPSAMSTVNAVPGMAGLAYPLPKGPERPTASATPKPTSGTSPTAKPEETDHRAAAGEATSTAIQSPSPGGDDDPDTSAEPDETVTALMSPGTQVEGFGPPSEAEPDGETSPLASPVLWGGLGAAGIGTGFGVRWLRKRSR